MVLGIGTDILSLARMRRVLACDTEVFLRRTFTPWEREQASLREDPVLFYATRFSAKESVFKSLNLSSDGVRLDEIEIRQEETGRPWVILTGDLKTRASANGVMEVLVSLSWDGEYAISNALAQGNAP